MSPVAVVTVRDHRDRMDFRERVHDLMSRARAGITEPCAHPLRDAEAAGFQECSDGSVRMWATCGLCRGSFLIALREDFEEHARQHLADVAQHGGPRAVVMANDTTPEAADSINSDPSI